MTHHADTPREPTLRSLVPLMLLLALLAPTALANPIWVDAGWVYVYADPTSSDPVRTASVRASLPNGVPEYSVDPDHPLSDPSCADIDPTIPVCEVLAVASYLICGGVAGGQVWLGLASTTGGCQEIYRTGE